VFKEERTWNLGGSENKVFTLILLLNIEPIKINTTSINLRKSILEKVDIKVRP
jgi:Fe2+ transport system protein FeoA